MLGLDSFSLAEPAIDMTTIREWAGEIGNSYLKAGVEPTHSLCKIAQAESLTPHQIEVLAAEANKAIHSAKYASISEKYHAADFPLADAKRAIASLQLDGGSTKIAAEFSPPKFEDKGPDAYEMFGIKPEVMDKTASVRHEVKHATAKSELLLQKLNDKLITLEYEKTAAERDFIKQARQIMLDQDSAASRMKVLGVFDHFVKVAGMKQGKGALAKLAMVLAREGKLEPLAAQEAVEYFMSKTADQKAPQALISENLQAQIINGNHPLYITLKTVGDREADLLRFEAERDLVQDKLRLLKQKIRAL